MFQYWGLHQTCVTLWTDIVILSVLDIQLSQKMFSNEWEDEVSINVVMVYIEGIKFSIGVVYNFLESFDDIYAIVTPLPKWKTNWMRLLMNYSVHFSGLWFSWSGNFLKSKYCCKNYQQHNIEVAKGYNHSGLISINILEALRKLPARVEACVSVSLQAAGTSNTVVFGCNEKLCETTVALTYIAICLGK